MIPIRSDWMNEVSNTEAHFLSSINITLNASDSCQWGGTRSMIINYRYDNYIHSKDSLLIAAPSRSMGSDVK